MIKIPNLKHLPLSNIILLLGTLNKLEFEIYLRVP